MKGSFFAVAALIAGVQTSAQTVQFVSVSLGANYVQTGPNSETDIAAHPTVPFQFTASIELSSGATSSGPITSATFTPAGGSATTLNFESDSRSWRYRDTSPVSMGGMTITYPSGTYTFNPSGTPNSSTTVEVPDFSASVLQAPFMTLSGGSWVGNTYVISASATLTISMNPIYTADLSGSPTAAFHFDSSVNGDGGFFDGPNDFAHYDPTISDTATYMDTPPNFVLTGGMLTAGNYTIEAGYDDVQNAALGVYGSGFSAAILEYRTSINLQVIPEPSTYAAIFGAVALAGVMLRRRRQQMA